MSITRRTRSTGGAAATGASTSASATGASATGASTTDASTGAAATGASTGAAAAGAVTTGTSLGAATAGASTGATTTGAAGASAGAGASEAEAAGAAAAGSAGVSSTSQPASTADASLASASVVPVLAAAWSFVALSWSFFMGSAARIIAKPGPPSAGDWPDRVMPAVEPPFSTAGAAPPVRAASLSHDRAAQWVVIGPVVMTSKSLPRICLSVLMAPSFQLGLGEPVRYQELPLSARNIPYFLSAVRMTCICLE